MSCSPKKWKQSDPQVSVGDNKEQETPRGHAFWEEPGTCVAEMGGRVS